MATARESIPVSEENSKASGRPGVYPGESRLKSVLLWSDVAVFFLLGGVAYLLGPATWFKVVGVGLAAAGFVVWMIARWQLGRSFSAVARARALVDTGLYRRFRHPIYLFGAIAHFGVFLAWQNWWILATWLVISPLIQWKRSKREDAVLQEAFGEAFVELRKGTWF